VPARDFAEALQNQADGEQRAVDIETIARHMR
jgi:hypothetical protein